MPPQTHIRVHYICDVCHGLTNCLLCERRSFPCAGVWCSCRRPGLTDVIPVFVRGRTSRRDAIMVIDDEPLASHDFSKQFSDLPDAPPPPSPPASPPPGRSESPQQMMGLEDESGDLNLTAPAPLHFGQPLLILPHGHQDYTHASVWYNSACVCPACVPVVSPDIPSGTDDFAHAMFEHLNIQCLCAECTPLEGAPADENVYHVPPEDVETDSSTDEDMPELVPGSDNSDSGNEDDVYDARPQLLRRVGPHCPAVDCCLSVGHGSPPVLFDPSHIFRDEFFTLPMTCDMLPRARANMCRLRRPC